MISGCSLLCIFYTLLMNKLEEMDIGRKWAVIEIRIVFIVFTK